MKSPLFPLPVFVGKHLRAWPKHEDGGRASYQPAAAALRARYATDAHTAAYSVERISRRLDAGAPGYLVDGERLVVRVAFLFVDVDGAGHRADPAWRAREVAKEAAVLAAIPGGFSYQTRGGYRLVWRLSSPFAIAGRGDANGWKLTYWRTLLMLSRRFGIVGDPVCADWTRLFRLPHATRDPGGAPEDLPTGGDPELLEGLELRLDHEDLDADLAEARRLNALYPASVDVDGQLTAAGPWSAALRALVRAAEEPSKDPSEPGKPWEKGSASATRGGRTCPDLPGRPALQERERLWCQKALERMATGVARASRGGRNNAVRDAALILGHYAPHLLDPDAIERALLAACERNELVRDDGREGVLTTMRHALSDGMATPKRPELPDDPPNVAHLPTTTTRSAQLVSDEGANHPREQPARTAKHFHTTDTGNAERLVALHGRDLRYCHPWGKWLVWDGRRWQEDAQAAIKHRAKLTALSIYLEAAAITDPSDAAQARRKDLSGWARKSEGRDRREAMVALAQSEPGIPVMPQELDADHWLLNVENGTLDLRTGELREHRREDLMTKLAPVKYDRRAEAPAFRAFLDSITGGDLELQGFLQRFFGYALTGETREHVLLNCYGTGSNGKSTLLKAFMALMGDYAYQAPADLLMVKKGESHPTDQAGLFKRRLVVCMETPAGRVMDEARMKALTGGDMVTARRMREDFWSFEPTHKLVIGTNHKPSIRTTDHGTWRRQKLLPFTVEIPPERQDKELPRKLAAEASGLLSWAVDGCIAWQREGGLGEPAAVREATQGWRDENDPLGAFLSAECELGEGFRAESAGLHAAYQRWAEATDSEQMSKQALGRRLSERGLEQGRLGGVRFWRGIRHRLSGSQVSYFTLHHHTDAVCQSS